MDDRTKAIIEELRAENKCLKERIEALEQENRRVREELEKAQQQMARQAALFDVKNERRFLLRNISLPGKSRDIRAFIARSRTI